MVFDVENIDILLVYICIFEYHSIIFELSTRPFDTRSDSHSTSLELVHTLCISNVFVYHSTISVYLNGTYYSTHV